MKDSFDKYFEDHRENLDTQEPKRDALWNEIESSLNNKKTKRSLLLWRVAAILLAFVAVGQLTYILIQPKPDSVGVYAVEEENEGPFEKLEASYQFELSTLQKKVEAKKIDRTQYAVLLDELEYVDQIENEFKQDLPLTNDREKLAAILIDTYEKKIMLLERLLLQIDRDEKQEQKLKKNWVPLNNSNKSLSL